MRFYGWLLPVSFGLGLSVLVATPIMKEPESGDWLSFAGAMMGTGLAVVGALLVEHVKIRRAQVQDLNRLSAALEKLEQALIFMSVEPEGAIAERAWQLRLRALNALPAFAAVEYALSRMDLVDVTLWFEVNSFSGMLTSKALMMENQELYLQDPTAAMVDQRLSLMARSAIAHLPLIARAQARIRELC